MSKRNIPLYFECCFYRCSESCYTYSLCTISTPISFSSSYSIVAATRTPSAAPDCFPDAPPTIAATLFGRIQLIGTTFLPHTRTSSTWNDWHANVNDCSRAGGAAGGVAAGAKTADCWLQRRQPPTCVKESFKINDSLAPLCTALSPSLARSRPLSFALAASSACLHNYPQSRSTRQITIINTTM